MKTREFFLAFAVAAAAIATSCVKEQIEEPQDKPGVEITGQVFEANHEVLTKSTLVGLTPTWVEGDKIFVSGNKDAVCTFVEDNKFQTEEDVTIDGPFYAIYPAAEGHTVDAGVFTATVPSLQKIDVAKKQNVAQGALVAAAYSETQELSFRNAVGLVKINIARNDIMAVKIEGLGENEFVAGQFTMKLNGDEEPEIALVEDTGVKSVTLNTVENYGMFTPGEYYAAVLPCNLSGIKVTFSRKTFTYDENGEVTGTGSETISVQKQSAAEIKRNSGADLGTFFTYEISTAADLLAWNKANAKWTVWDVVTLKDNINCSAIESKDWTPNEFKGVFDGNGKTIDNLVIKKAGTSAFFSKLTGAVVKDLTFGSGCSFVSTATEVSSPAEGSNHNYAASLAGAVREHTSISNVVNRGTVKIEGDATSGTGGYYLGGICAYNIALGAAGEMKNCKNYGDITFAAKPNGHVYVAGVSGSIATNNVLTLTGCENHGKVQFTGENTAGKDINLGGITAIANKVTFTSCANLGAVESNVAGTNSGLTNIGGFVGVMNNACGTISDCVNGSETDNTKGAVTNNAASSKVVRIGGFVGSVYSKKIDVAGFKNYGTITNAGAVTAWTAIGGVAGYIGSMNETNTVSGCENHGLVNSTKVSEKTAVGGIVGFIQYANTTVTGCKNHGEVKNTGTSPANIGVTVAGIVGRIEAAENGNNTISSCENRGQISYAAKNESDAEYLSGVAGILGGHTGTFNSQTKVYSSATVTISDCSNWNVIEKTKDGNNNIFLGGIAAFLFGPEGSASHIANISNCTNNKDASVLNNSTNYGGWYTYTGGIVGHHTVSGQMSGCKNYAEVTNTALTSSKAWDAIRVGGIGGSVAFTSMENCSNYGVVSDQSNSNSGIVGGVVGRVIGKGLTMTNCDNEGAVSGKFNNSTERTLLAVGGVVGVSSPKLVMTKCDNKGDISQYNTCTTTLEMVGGLVAYTAELAEISECSSKATITSARGTNYDYVGAFIGRFLKPASTITSSMVAGTFNGTALSASNYTTYCFGTKSENKTTTGITFGTN
ncbi:MAG: hypothetical protein E7123_08905 [Bacteroidales bacterium]|nr:hypothetical protein [Bacteroidales bacterium]